MKQGRGIIDLKSFMSLAKDISDSIEAQVPKTAGGGAARLTISSGSVNSQASSAADMEHSKIEDLSRSAVVGLSSEIRTILANTTSNVTGLSWVGLTWLDRYKLAKGIDRHLTGDELHYRVELERMPLDNPELEEMLARHVGSPPASREMAVRQVEKLSSGFESLIVQQDDGKLVQEMSEEEAKDAVLGYSASVRQKASEDASWPSSEWRSRLLLCRKRAAADEAKGGKKALAIVPDDSNFNFKFESLGGHWGDVFSGGEYAKRVAQYSADAAKPSSADKMTLRGGGRVLGRLLGTQHKFGKGKKGRARMASISVGAAVLPSLDEVSTFQSGVGVDKEGGNGSKPGSTAPATARSNKPGTSKSSRAATGNSSKSVASSKSSRVNEGEIKVAETKDGETKAEAKTLVRAERLHHLKKSAMRVNLGVRLSK